MEEIKDIMEKIMYNSRPVNVNIKIKGEWKYFGKYNL